MSELRSELAGTGVEVSAVCLGTMMFGGRTDESTSLRILSCAADYGLDFWDTAPMYNDTRTETIVGKALKSVRDRVFLSTKVHEWSTAQSIVDSCHQSLRRLNIDHIDLFQIHSPIEGMNLNEMIEGLDHLVASGKVRFVGCSNFPAWLLASTLSLAIQTNRVRMVSVQLPYSLLERGIEVELLPMCRFERIAVLAYRPLVKGLLTGKYRVAEGFPGDSRDTTDERMRHLLIKYGSAIDQLCDYAQAQEVSPSAVALSWVRSNTAVAMPIVGVSREQQLEELIQATDYNLDESRCRWLTEVFSSEVQEEGLGAYSGWRRKIDFVEPTSPSVPGKNQ